MGYTVPRFTLFTGTGNPGQHLAHFKINCGDTIDDHSMLLRQFSKSLSDTAFEWYTKLEPGSMKTFTQLEEAFKKRFDCGMSDKISLQELTEMRPNDKEAGSDFVKRWRDANMSCEQPVEEKHVIPLLASRLDPVTRLMVRIDDNSKFSNFIPDVA